MDDLAKLKLKADSLFRKMLHAKHGRYVMCPTCGRQVGNSAMTVGHSFRRSELSVRWDLRFAELQCWPCNMSGDGTERMREYLRAGNPGFDDEANYERRIRYGRWEIEARIEEMKAKLSCNQ